MTLIGSNLDTLASVYREKGPFSSVYLDVSGDVNDPERTGELRRRAVIDRLKEQGAPAADVDAIERELLQLTGVGGAVSRLVVVRDGEVLVSELIEGPRQDTEIAEFGPVPDLTPIVEHRPDDFHYLVVEVGRDGGELRLFRTGSIHPVHRDDIAGDTDSLHKVQVGGWSQARYQRHSEEVWKHNQADIAGAVDRVVNQYHPRFIALAGDVRARQLLEEKLSAAAKAVLTTVAADTRADGASDQALVEHIDAKLTEIAERDRETVTARILDQAGRDGAHGVGEVLSAVRQGQVDTMLIDCEAARKRTLLALDSEPWVASAPEDALDAKVLATVPATLALLRAAALTGAKVLCSTRENLPDGQTVAALLRWPIGPSD